MGFTARTAPKTRTLAATGIDDASLVARAREGDRWAEDALYRRHARSIAGTAARLLGSRQDVDDIVHDAFVQALAQLDRLREPSLFRPWLTQIAVSRVRKLLRRRRLSRMLGLFPTHDDASLERLARGQSDRGETRAELALIDGILRKLPAEQRIAWMLRWVEGYALAEVAELSDCSLATAKRRIAAAHKQLLSVVDLEPTGGDA